MAVLCFGSFASIIKKAIPKIGDIDLVQLLYGAVDSFERTRTDTNNAACRNSVKGDHCKRRKSELAVTATVVASANSITDMAELESYFSTEVISKFGTTHTEAMCILYALVKIIDTTIPTQTRNNILEVARTDFLPAFLARSFLYAVKQNNVVADNSIDGITPVPLPKPPRLAPSITPRGIAIKNFEEVFSEIHREELTLLSTGHIRTFCLDFSNNNFIFGALDEFLNDIVGQYVLTRLQIDGLLDTKKVHTIVDKAKAAVRKSIDSAKYGDGFGDIMLYAFLEKVLGAPKLYSKIELIETQGGAVIGQGGIHLLPNPGDNKSFQFVIGKSNVCGDIRTAIDNAFSAIASANTTAEYTHLDSTILAKSFDQATAEYLRSIILPSNRKKEGVTVHDAYGIFLGYSLGLGAVPVNEFETKAHEKMVADIQSQLEYIKQKISSANLSACSFYFYLVPFNNADNEKQSIMQTLIGGGTT